MCNYGFMSTKEVAYFVKGDYQSFIPIEQLRFIGRLEDWGEDVV